MKIISVRDSGKQYKTVRLHFGAREVYQAISRHVQNIARESGRRARETKNESNNDSKLEIVD